MAPPLPPREKVPRKQHFYFLFLFRRNNDMIRVISVMLLCLSHSNKSTSSYALSHCVIVRVSVTVLRGGYTILAGTVLHCYLCGWVASWSPPSLLWLLCLTGYWSEADWSLCGAEIHCWCLGTETQNRQDVKLKRESPNERPVVQIGTDVCSTGCGFTILDFRWKKYIYI